MEMRRINVMRVSVGHCENLLLLTLAMPTHSVVCDRLIANGQDQAILPYREGARF